MSALPSVPEQVLLSFFSEATKTLQSCQTNKPLSRAECRHFLLEQQRTCLQNVVQQHDDLNSGEHRLTLDQVQSSLGELSSNADNTTDTDRKLKEAMDTMNDTARLAFAKLVLASECLRTSTISLNFIQEEGSESKRLEPLKTSRITRSELLEFCALSKASVRLENVHDHLIDAQNPLWKGLFIPNSAEAADSSFQRNIPPIKRVENLQRLLIQAIGYDAEMGIKEMARHLQTENDDIELVQAIRQSTSAMMESLLGDFSSARRQSPAGGEMLSDLTDGGVTRIVSVQHSETVINVDNAEHGTQVRTMGAAPVQQSIHDNSKEQWDMAKQAAALRESLARELNNMSNDDQTELLERAEQALRDFQEQAMQRPAGSERVEFLRSMDAETQKLLAMHRIWQEKQQQEQQQQQQQQQH